MWKKLVQSMLKVGSRINGAEENGLGYCAEENGLGYCADGERTGILCGWRTDWDIVRMEYGLE